jgi:CubicO group peptidase (beta-lactamase class C family)
MTGAGLSKQRLERMHEVMSGRVGGGLLPGMVTAIDRHGDAVIDAMGTLALDSDAPMRPDSIFRIASITKPITAVATMILAEECRIRLDEPVDRWLPELADRQVLRRPDGPLDDTEPARRPITVWDCLTFTLGLGLTMDISPSDPIQAALADRFGPPGPPKPASGPDADEAIRRLGTLPLMHQPGDRWMYNTGSDVLGVLIARAAGQPFGAFLAERIFEPLGMRDTGFHVPATQIDRLTTSYAPDPVSGDLTVFDLAVGGDWSGPPMMESGAGGLVSTADDLIRFGRMLLGGGRLNGERILARPSVELITSDHLTASQKAATRWVPGYFDSHGWGFGVGVVTRRDDVMSIGTFGWEGGLGTSWCCDPREDLVGVLLTQRAMTSPAATKLLLDFWTGVYQTIDD